MMEKEQNQQKAEEVRERNLGEIYRLIKVLSDGLVSQKGAMEKIERLMGTLGERQDNIQKRVDELDFSKSVITNPELIDELESHTAQVTSLALQIEKLAKLRSDGGVSESIYAELYEDLERKVEDVRMERKGLTESASARINEMGSEAGDLRYRLERLEVRRKLDFITEEKYSASKEELMKRITENDEAMMLIAKLLAATEEAFKKIDACMPERPEEKKEELRERVEMRRPLVRPAQTQPRQFQVVRDTRQLFRPIQKMALLQQKQSEDLQQKQREDKPSSFPVSLPKAATVPQTLPVTREPVRVVEEEKKAEGDMICPKCKWPNQKESVFCIKCGSRIMERREAPAPKVEDMEKRESLGPIRENLKPIIGIKACPKCGLENLSVASYCYHCNANLRESELEAGGTWKA